MIIEHDGKKIESVSISSYEQAWRLGDVFVLLDYYLSSNEIVLGGDILTQEYEYSYDNWYYNIDNNKDTKTNSSDSIFVAKEYLSNYVKRNGCDFFVVLITQK